MITFRTATHQDAALLRRWDAEPHIIAAKGTEDWQWETELERTSSSREHLIATIDGKPIGFVQLLDPAADEHQYWGPCAPGARAIDIWIGEPACLGRGHGTRMMNLALARCFSDPGVHEVVIDPLAANHAALRFYERLGFRFVEFRTFGDDKCAVHRIRRDDWQTPIPTARVRMRSWTDDDLDAFAAMNADREVTRFLPSPLTRDESDAFAQKIREGIQRDGFGLWAAERLDVPGNPFVGFVGLWRPTFDAPFTPCVEIGWRVAREHWGVGLATEAANAVVSHAFNRVGLSELVSFTVPANLASRRVMEKIGMQHDATADFDHPRLPDGHPLRRHVLYRMTAPKLGS